MDNDTETVRCDRTHIKNNAVPEILPPKCWGIKIEQMESAQNSHLEKANGKLKHSQELCVSKNKSKALIDPHLSNDKFI